MRLSATAPLASVASRKSWESIRRAPFQADPLERSRWTGNATGAGDRSSPRGPPPGGGSDDPDDDDPEVQACTGHDGRDLSSLRQTGLEIELAHVERDALALTPDEDEIDPAVRRRRDARAVDPRRDTRVVDRRAIGVRDVARRAHCEQRWRRGRGQGRRPGRTGP